MRISGPPLQNVTLLDSPKCLYPVCRLWQHRSRRAGDEGGTVEESFCTSAGTFFKAQLTARCLAPIYAAENLFPSTWESTKWFHLSRRLAEQSSYTTSQRKLQNALSWDCERIQIGQRLRLCRQKKSFKKTSWIGNLNGSQAACLHLMCAKAPKYFLLFQSCPAFHSQLPFPRGTNPSISREIHCSVLLSINGSNYVLQILYGDFPWRYGVWLGLA